MLRSRRLGQVIELDVPSDQSAQAAVRYEVGAPTEKAADERAHADRE
jgi:hypothetical protein